MRLAEIFKRPLEKIKKIKKRKGLGQYARMVQRAKPQEEARAATTEELIIGCMMNR